MDAGGGITPLGAWVSAGLRNVVMHVLKLTRSVMSLDSTPTALERIEITTTMSSRQRGFVPAQNFMFPCPFGLPPSSCLSTTTRYIFPHGLFLFPHVIVTSLGLCERRLAYYTILGLVARQFHELLRPRQASPYVQLVAGLSSRAKGCSEAQGCVGDYFISYSWMATRVYTNLLWKL